VRLEEWSIPFAFLNIVPQHPVAEANRLPKHLRTAEIDLLGCPWGLNKSKITTGQFFFYKKRRGKTPPEHMGRESRGRALHFVKCRAHGSRQLPVGILTAPERAPANKETTQRLSTNELQHFQATYIPSRSSGTTLKH
jgi:hypothetical protein